ncbi:hypothetical protein [Streptomyces hokutonensis]|uniref:hypothetical protein n=1 Tax=Streptomyces hokutonensis TaxID=1306990 RepID=UPI000380838A|nr:hypothetical protein [Streptomyces hokutonensis]
MQLALALAGEAVEYADTLQPLTEERLTRACHCGVGPPNSPVQAPPNWSNRCCAPVPTAVTGSPGNGW